LAAVILSVPGARGAEAAPDAAESTVKFEDFPDEVAPGKPFRLRVDFELGRLVSEHRRAVLIIELRDLATDAVLWQKVDDNMGFGFRAPLERMIYMERIPSLADGEGYFAAYLAPFGMNEYVLEEIERYPTDGTHRYLWKGGGSGHTKDLYYLGEKIFPGTPQGTTYCCGLTYEVFLGMFNRYNEAMGHRRVGVIDAEGMKEARAEWYGDLGSMERQLVARMVREGIGIEIEDKTEARAGDFMEIWRYSGSGHSVIFLEWVREGDAVTGLRYWSAQPGTNGIAVNVEPLGPPKGIRWDRSYVGRLRKPRDARDWRDRYADASTKGTPTKLAGAAGGGR